MAAIRQILELLRSHADGDNERFRTAALQLAANEARQGHDKVAMEIQKLLERVPRVLRVVDQGQGTNSIPFSRPQGELAGLIEATQPRVGLNQLILSKNLELRLSRVIKEQRQFSRLREHGLRPRQRLMLLGPPGCGKTITAHALAHDLGLPLFVVQLDALFTKYLGETASKLRLIFDAVEKYRAVFLFDEFDSIGLARGTEHDVAEMRRVLNSFLVFIDNMQGHSMIITASNHPEALDPALFRRFDDIIEYSAPTPAELRKLFEQRFAHEEELSLDWEKILGVGRELSFAEAARVANDALKERLIENQERVTTEVILNAIKERYAKKRTKKRVTKTKNAT